MPASNNTPINTCPNCGSSLSPIALDPNTAPWLCSHCKLGWWSTEITPQARAAWHGPSRSFHWRNAPAIRAAVDQERAEAQSRGTSLRIDQINLFDSTTLATLQAKLGPGTLSDQMTQVLDGRKAQGSAA